MDEYEAGWDAHNLAKDVLEKLLYNLSSFLDDLRLNRNNLSEFDGPFRSDDIVRINSVIAEAREELEAALLEAETRMRTCKIGIPE
jgi:hypothetical protein